MCLCGWADGSIKVKRSARSLGELEIKPEVDGVVGMEVWLEEAVG